MAWEANFWICYTTCNYLSIGLKMNNYCHFIPSTSPSPGFGFEWILTQRQPHSRTAFLPPIEACFPNLIDFGWYRAEQMIFSFDRKKNKNNGFLGPQNRFCWYLPPVAIPRKPINLNRLLAFIGNTTWKIRLKIDDNDIVEVDYFYKYACNVLAEILYGFLFVRFMA